MYDLNMIDFITNIYNEYQILFFWLGIMSILTIIASIVLVPLFIKHIPIDYFTNSKYHQIKLNNAYNIAKFILRNILGLLLIIAGIIMLLTPGKGIISIIIGLFLMQFKGKYKLEKKLIQNDATFKTLNWIREKTNKKPFLR
jgi:hypothetical protein